MDHHKSTNNRLGSRAFDLSKIDLGFSYVTIVKLLNIVYSDFSIFISHFD